MSPSTIRSYNKTLSDFYKFVKALNTNLNSFPANSGHVALYITHLHRRGLAPSTITSKMSPISFIHKLYNKHDPVQNFLVSKLLKGLRKIRPVNDTRLPISPSMLSDMVSSLPVIGFSLFEQLIFKAMATLAFAAFLRPGEMTESPNNLQFQDVSLFRSHIIVVFRRFKHSSGVPVTLVIKASGTSSCPFNALTEYIGFRGTAPGLLFCHPDGRPITYKKFSSWFDTATILLGAHGSLSPHSLRISAASHAAASGMSDALIRQWGRWASDAFKNYIRIPALLG